MSCSSLCVSCLWGAVCHVCRVCEVVCVMNVRWCVSCMYGVVCNVCEVLCVL